MDPVTLSLIAGTKLVGGIVDYYRGNKKMKEAEATIDSEVAALKKIEYTNRYADLQVPTSALEAQSQERLSEMANIADVARSSGPQGVAVLPGLSARQEIARQQDAIRQDEMEFKADVRRREGQTAVDYMNKEFQKQLGMGEIEGARIEQGIGRDLKSAGIQGIANATVSGLGMYFGAKAENPYMVDAFGKFIGIDPRATEEDKRLKKALEEQNKKD